MTSVQAGEVEAVHAVTTEHVWAQQGVVVEGQTDILTMGLPYISPYNVNSILNPILVACLGLGYFFNLYRGKPLVREGGVVIMTHPTPWEFDPVHHPSYIDFFEQVLSETTDPSRGRPAFEEGFATDPWYIHLYRTGHAYHGVHPFYMWYWCAHALEHLGAVVIVGGDPAAVRRLGLPGRLHAGRRPRDGRGRRGPVPHAHPPPRPADPDGRRPVTAAGTRPRTLRSTPRGCGPTPTSRVSRRRSDARSDPGAVAGPGRPSRGFRWPLPPGPVRCPDRRPNASSASDYDTAWSRRYPVRLARAMVLDNVTRPLAQVSPRPNCGATRGSSGLEAPVIFAANHASHVDTPLLLSCLPRRVPPPHRRRRGRRLLLRPPVEGGHVLVPARRHPHRAQQGQPAVRRPGRRAAGRRVEPGHLPGGRPIARRLGPGVHGRRRLPGGPHRSSGGPGAHRRHPAHPAQGSSTIRRTRTTVTFGTPLWPVDGENARRFGRPDRGGGGHAGRRVAHRLVDGAESGGAGRDTAPPRSRRRRLAAVVGTRLRTRSLGADGRRRQRLAAEAGADHRSPAAVLSGASWSTPSVAMRSKSFWSSRSGESDDRPVHDQLGDAEPAEPSGHVDEGVHETRAVAPR